MPRQVPHPAVTTQYGSAPSKDRTQSVSTPRLSKLQSSRRSPSHGSLPKGARESGASRRAMQTTVERLRAAIPGGDDSLLTARALAELCGVELKTVHNWATEGLIQHFRTPGRHLRFRSSDVLIFLEECGYDLRDEAAPRTAVVVASGAVRSALRRKLKGLSSHFTADPLGALIAAGRLEPDLFLVSPDELSSVVVSDYVRALRKELPAITLVWLEPTSKRSRRMSPPGCLVIPASEIGSLRSELGLD